MTAVILAGGHGRRMGGRDKGEIQLGAQRMIDRVYDKLSKQDADILLSGDNDYALGLKTIPDLDEGPKGPAAGLYAISRSLMESVGNTGFFTVPIDGPNFPNDLLLRLYNANFSAIASDETGLHPTYAWWRLQDLKQIWEQMEAGRAPSLKQIAEMTKAKTVEWPGASLFANINTPENLAEYLKIKT